MFHYTFDDREIDIQEFNAERDTTYRILAKTESMRERLKQVRHFFEGNEDYTDVLFYSLEDGSFEVIVRTNMIEIFLIHAFRFKCLQSVCWE